MFLWDHTFQWASLAFVLSIFLRCHSSKLEGVILAPSNRLLYFTATSFVRFYFCKTYWSISKDHLSLLLQLKRSHHQIWPFTFTFWEQKHHIEPTLISMRNVRANCVVISECGQKRAKEEYGGFMNIKQTLSHLIFDNVSHFFFTFVRFFLCLLENPMRDEAFINKM